MEMCAAIGSVLSKTNTETFSPDAQVLKNLNLLAVLTRCGFPQDKICRWLQMGWNATRTSTPVNMIGYTLPPTIPVEAKQAQFANAEALLNEKGLTAGSPATIGFDPELRTILLVTASSFVPQERACGLPASGIQGACMFSTSPSSGQPTRQALRRFLKDVKMQNADGKLLDMQNAVREPFVIFCFCRVLLMMMINGDDVRYPDHFAELRKLALIQCDMQPMIAPGSYGPSFSSAWSQSGQPRLHFSKPITCTSLHKDVRINPWKEPELTWWACMMATLGEKFFAAQLNFFRMGLIDAGLTSDQLTIPCLIAFMREKHPIAGQMSFVTICNEPISLGTLEPFSEDDIVYVASSHLHARSRIGGVCDTEQCYSDQDLAMFQRTCGWCGASGLEFKRIEIRDNKSVVSEAMRTGTPYRITSRGRDTKEPTPE